MTTTITALEVIQLPFRVTEFDEDGLVALARNFATIEENLGKLQVYMNDVGLSIINNSGTLIGNIVLEGLDAAKPAIDVREGHWFYWATDTHKVYLLRPNPA